jgi:hypothetical protein
MAAPVEITGTIVGLEKVVANFTEAGAAYSLRVSKAVHAGGLDVLARVKDTYLNGDALNVRSGRLRRSTNEKFYDGGNSFTSTVGTNVSYGRAWELGFDRKIGAGARGGPRTLKTAKAIARYQQKHPVGVKHYDARAFLQPSLADMKDKIHARIAAALSGKEA